jgi:hypothetical protein
LRRQVRAIRSRDATGRDTRSEINGAAVGEMCVGSRDGHG